MASNKEKQAKFDQWMEGDHILLHLDSTAEGIELPPEISGNPSLTLKLSYNFQGETLRDENEITTYLKFSGNYFKCVIPWKAVWGITSEKQEQVIWSDDLPKELVLQLAKQQFSQLGKKLFGKKDKNKTLDIKTGKTIEKPKSKLSHLKRIK